jgi:hypothetical protein
MSFIYSVSYLARTGSRDYMTQRVKQQLGIQFCGHWRNNFFGKNEGKINCLNLSAKLLAKHVLMGSEIWVQRSQVLGAFTGRCVGRENMLHLLYRTSFQK